MGGKELTIKEYTIIERWSATGAIGAGKGGTTHSLYKSGGGKICRHRKKPPPG